LNKTLLFLTTITRTKKYNKNNVSTTYSSLSITSYQTPTSSRFERENLLVLGVSSITLAYSIPILIPMPIPARKKEEKNAKVKTRKKKKKFQTP